MDEKNEEKHLKRHERFPTLVENTVNYSNIPCDLF